MKPRIRGAFFCTGMGQQAMIANIAFMQGKRDEAIRFYRDEVLP
ncbi:hypothetical protein [Thiohalocapsa sp.]|nr:hypothetical protein [Thiohalocapsa sp.]